MMGIALALAIAGSIGLLVYSVLEFGFSEERQVAVRLRAMTEYESSEAVSIEPLLTPFSERVLRPVASWLASVVGALFPKDYRRSLEQRLEKAGHPHGLRVHQFIALKAACVFSCVVVKTLVDLAFSVSAGIMVATTVAAIVTSFFLPDLWLHMAREKRRDAIRRALPDMLDMLVISVEAGLGFDQAVTKVIRNTGGPLAEEFGRMLQEVQAGASRRDALRNLAERCDVPELSAFVLAMQQADTFGISVSQVLRTQARELRVRRRQYAETQAQKAPVKLVFPLVLCILPATLIVVAGPAIVSIGVSFGLAPV